MLRSLFVAAAAALTMVAAAGPAQAAVVRATISNGVFDDTGTVSGWFDFDDAAIAAPSAWNLTTTARSALPAEHYESGAAGQTAVDTTLLGVFRQFEFLHDNGSTTSALLLVLADPGPGQAIEFGCVFCASFSNVRNGTFDYALAAPPTTAPEPAVWLLTLLGFGLTGATLRRRATPATA